MHRERRRDPSFLVHHSVQDSIANQDRNLGIELYESGRYPEAIEPLRRVLIRDARDSQCLRLLAHALFNSGRARESIARFRAPGRWESVIDAVRSALIARIRGRWDQRGAASSRSSSKPDATNSV